MSTSPESRPITMKHLIIAATFGGALVAPATWAVALTTRVAVLETKVSTLEVRLEKMDGKLDTLLTRVKP